MPCNGSINNDVRAGQAVAAAVAVELCSGGHWSGMRAVRHCSLSTCTAAEHCYCLSSCPARNQRSELLIHTMLFSVSKE